MRLPGQEQGVWSTCRSISRSGPDGEHPRPGVNWVLMSGSRDRSRRVGENSPEFLADDSELIRCVADVATWRTVRLGRRRCSLESAAGCRPWAAITSAKRRPSLTRASQVADPGAGRHQVSQTARSSIRPFRQSLPPSGSSTMSGRSSPGQAADLRGIRRLAPIVERMREPSTRGTSWLWRPKPCRRLSRAIHGAAELQRRRPVPRWGRHVAQTPLAMGGRQAGDPEQSTVVRPGTRELTGAGAACSTAHRGSESPARDRGTHTRSACPPDESWPHPAGRPRSPGHGSPARPTAPATS